MGVATLGAPATVSAPMRLAGDQTLVPPSVGNTCDVTVPAIVTTVLLPSLPTLTTCSSAQTTSLTVGGAPSGAVATASGSNASPSDARSSDAHSSSTAARPGSASTASSTESTTAAGVLGGGAGTPSAGTDIAFGIGIGLVIAGAGIGTGTGAFLKRRRTTP